MLPQEAIQPSLFVFVFSVVLFLVVLPVHHEPTAARTSVTFCHYVVFVFM